MLTDLSKLAVHNIEIMTVVMISAEAICSTSPWQLRGVVRLHG